MIFWGGSLLYKRGGSPLTLAQLPKLLAKFFRTIGCCFQSPSPYVIRNTSFIRKDIKCGENNTVIFSCLSICGPKEGRLGLICLLASVPILYFVRHLSLLGIFLFLFRACILTVFIIKNLKLLTQTLANFVPLC